ncbi:MAG: ABC transporter ATP-binding protein [Clostridia bacterium]|nr:ABC transporter ATP-binding protein [Clostridia bacterium]
MLEIKNLNKKYDDHVIFKDFNIQLKENEINCILGASGCGKTTLLNIIAHLDSDYEGTLEGFDHKTYSYIFQETRLLNWFTVHKNLEVILKGYEDIEERIDKYLEIVELDRYREYYPYQLSGGMKQRLSIARAFAFKSDILLMDEPFKGLDPALKKSLVEAFIRLWEQDKRTIIFVTHDIEESILLGDDIYILGDQPIKEIFRTNISIEKSDRTLNDSLIDSKKQMIYSIFMSEKE